MALTPERPHEKELTHERIPREHRHDPEEALSRLWTVTEPGIPLLMNVTLTIRPERLDAFTAALREVLAHARAEDACLHLDVGRSVADSGVFVLSEAGVTSSSTATSSSRRTFSSSTCRSTQTPTPNPGL